MNRFSRPVALFHPVLHCRDASRTRQEFLVDSLIGNVIKRFCLTGVLDQPNLNRPLIDGLSLPSDFTEGMNGITRIQNEGITEADLENHDSGASPDVENQDVVDTGLTRETVLSDTVDSQEVQ